MIKNKRFVLIILVLFSLLFSHCSQKPVHFSISKGTALRKQFPTDFRPQFPILTITNHNKTARYELPLGTTIWQNKSKSGYLVLKYMDKRFAAFGSDAFIFVDLKEGGMIPIVTDVIYEVDSDQDDLLIGVQRIPIDVDYNEKFADTEYSNCIHVLFAIKFDYSEGRWFRRNILAGNSLSDDNQIISAEFENIYKDNLFVKNGILHYVFKKDHRELNLKSIGEITQIKKR